MNAPRLYRATPEPAQHARRTEQTLTLAQLGSAAPCISYAHLFQQAGGDKAAFTGARDRRNHSDYVDAARAICDSCLAHNDCLTRSLVGKPVDGFVAGTNPEQRKQLRAILNIAAQEEGDLTRTVGLDAGRIPVDQAALDAAILNSPDATNAELGRKVGCDAHTIARARRRLKAQPPAAPPAARTVKAAYLQVVTG